jgi:hypothetical protein
MLNDLKPPTEQLEKVYGRIMKEANDLRLQIAINNTLSAIDCQGKTFNTNIAEVQAKNAGFGPLDNIELVDQTSETNLQDYGIVRIFTTHLLSN